MKNHSKRLLSLLVVIMMIPSFFTACASNKPGKESEKEKAGTTIEREPVKLSVWYAVSGNSGEKFVEMSEKFQEQSELVDVELSYSGSSGDTATKVSSALLTGTAPDVALMYAGPLYTGGRDNYDIADLITRDSFNADDVYDGMWDYCTYLGDKVCAIPFGISTQVMYYNKDILKAAGVDMTNPPKTWSEFYDVCLKVLEKGNINNVSDFTAFDTSDEQWLFKSMLKQNGCEIVESKDGKVTPVFNNAQALEVAEYWKKLIDSKIMTASEHDNAENKFLSGNCAFIAASSNRISKWSDTSFELGAIEMPYFKKQSLALGGNVLVILTQDPQRVEAAWEYIEYLTSTKNNAEFALATGYLPIRKSTMDEPEIKKAIEDNEMYGIAFKQLDYTWAYTHFEQMGTMDTLIGDMLNNLEKNTAAPQKLLDDTVKELTEEIDQ